MQTARHWWAAAKQKVLQKKKLFMPVYGLVAFALVFNPLMPLVRYLPAYAADSADVVINEFSANGSADWIELYNTTGASIDLTNWELHDSASLMETLGSTIPANGFLVVEVSDRLNANTDEIHLFDDAANPIDSLVYNTTGSILYPGSGESTARTTDGGITWAAGVPTKGVTNMTTTTSGTLLAENFNTHSGSDYKGISVGFNAKNFGTVTGIAVTLERADGSTVTKTSGPAVLSLINSAGWDAGDGKLSTPFVIQEGTFTEAGDVDSNGDLYWNPAPATSWSTATTPTKAIIEVIDENGAKTSVANASLSEATATYFSLLPQAPNTVVVYGDTAAGENQPGWLFNRDTSTATPFEFSTDQASIGSGSLYVKPIGGANPNDKFIAENFLAKPVDQLNSIAYDFLIGAGGSAADANEFYLNVYANIDDTSNYYDCRFDYVTAAGSTADFTTATFAPTDTPAHVQKRGTRIASCPATLAGMPAGSYVRAFAVNVGDKTASDAGLDGYLDKVVVDAVGEKTTYDFEPDTAKPSVAIASPANGSLLTTGTFTVEGTASDNETSVTEVKYTVTEISGGIGCSSCHVQTVDSGVANGTSSWNFDVSGLDDGFYRLKVQAFDEAGNWKYKYHDVEIDTAAPAKVSGLQIRKGHSPDAPLLGCDGYTNARQIRIEWSHSPESDIDYYWFGTKFNEKHRKVDASKNFYHGNMSPGHNPYHYTVIAVDKAGNESPISDPCGLVLDTEAPVAEIVSPGDGDLLAGAVELKGKVSDDNPMNSFFRITGPGGYEETSLFTDGRTMHEFNWDTTGVADGTYTIFFATRDKADNKDGDKDNPGTSVDSITVTVDNTAPTAELTSPSDSAAVSGTVEVLGDVMDNIDLSHYNLSLYPGSTDLSDGLVHSGDRLNGTVGWGSGTVNVSGTGASVSRMLDTTLLPDGEYQLRLAARDAAGNRDTSGIGGAPNSVHVIAFTVDNTNPVVDAGSDDAIAGQAYNLAGAASDATTSVTATLWTQVSGPGVATFADAGALNTGVTVDTFGTYTFTLTATDAAGNTAADTVTITFNFLGGTGGGDGAQGDTPPQPAPNNTGILAAQTNNTNDGTEGENNNIANNENDDSEVLSTHDENHTGDATGNEDENGEVAGAANENSGFSPWWLLILAVLAAIGYYYFGRRSSKAKDES
jgi:hypothetical protein